MNLLTFPVFIPIGPWRLHPHVVFETLAYFVGFRLYLWQRRRLGDVITTQTRWSIVAAAIAGAALGSKMLFWLENPALTWQHLADPVFLMSGKTIVGGLAGGLIGVELTKLAIGVRESTGDLFAVPLAIGAEIGRIRGYPGPDGFWMQLASLMDRLPPPKAPPEFASSAPLQKAD